MTAALRSLTHLRSRRPTSTAALRTAATAAQLQSAINANCLHTQPVQCIQSHAFHPSFAPFCSPDRRLTVAHADSRDARSVAAVRRLAAGGSGSPPPFDLLLTDPPYCLLTKRRDGGIREASSRKKLLWDPTGAASTLRFADTADYAQFTMDWMRPLVDHMHPHAVWVIWTNALGREPIMRAVKELRPHAQLWQEVLWVKPTKPMSNSKPTVQHSVQPADAVPATAPSSRFYASAARAPWTHALPPPLTLPLQSAEMSFRCPEVALVFGVADGQQMTLAPNALVCPAEDELLEPPVLSAVGSSTPLAGTASAHPNAKPLRVLLPLLHAFSQPGALVLDPFGGSGAHAHAALAAGRRAATLEINSLWAMHIRSTLGAAMHHVP